MQKKKTIDRLNEINYIYITSMKKQLNVPSDWVFRTIGGSFNAIEELNCIIEHKNIIYVSGYARKNYAKQDFFISPDGINNLIKYQNKKAGVA